MNISILQGQPQVFGTFERYAHVKQTLRLTKAMRNRAQKQKDTPVKHLIVLKRSSACN